MSMSPGHNAVERQAKSRPAVMAATAENPHQPVTLALPPGLFFLVHPKTIRAGRALENNFLDASRLETNYFRFMPVKPWIKFNQFPLPKSPLPPLQLRYQKQPTKRGKDNTGYVADQAKRGRPFSGVWNNALGYPFFTFGSVGTYPKPTCDLQTFQDIMNAGDPLRRYNQIFNPKTKFRP